MLEQVRRSEDVRRTSKDDRETEVVLTVVAGQKGISCGSRKVQ
jgi:hypothetical protein